MVFQPGQSGNPGGRIKRTPEMQEAISLAANATPRAMQRLIDLIDSKDEKVSIAASNSIIDRTLGKAAQPIVGDKDHDPVQVDEISGLPRELRLKLQAKMLEAMRD